ncbi:hypothetical protein BDY21DRAFT_372252 [Lineolata rhizophorae]|uniref:Uncharacterized protein n=1 Tax=Lineolata rhizophorae TaxID=578093 RepID=A0A6A6NZ84_9PEZI|nr:hypothetical protein BDY21DRAFT_372252 [Lineolata rhizophorae]
MTGYHRNGQSPGSLVDFDDNGELFSFGEEQFEQLGAELRESAAERSDTQFIEDPEWLNEVIPQNQTGDVWAYQLDDVILQGTEMDQIGYANDYFQTEVQQNTLQAPLAFPSGPDEQQGVIANSSQDPTLLGIEPPFQEGSEMLTSSDFNQISAQLAIGHKPPSASVDATQLKYPLQKPRRSSSHWWVRINNTTEGKTIRSGKINQYDPKRYYKECPQPHGNWHSKYYAFRYNKFGELDKPMYSARQIHEFLFEHPRTEKFRLRLWIQRAPADSARRYHTPQSSRCRFKCCPAHKYTKGTILHGHLRVAFDERWHTYQKNADPFHCAGYVHLYCLERFLDFPAVCRHVDIKVDTRSFNTEPNHRFAAAFDNGPDLYLAETFLRTASRDLDAFKAKYPKYPDHADFERGAEKPYKETLCYLITKARHDARGAGTRKQLERVGGNKASTMAVHLGDLEVYCQARMEARKSKREAKRKRQDGGEDDSDSERHQKPRRAEAADSTDRLLSITTRKP